jgi:hypothetical protein
MGRSDLKRNSDAKWRELAKTTRQQAEQLPYGKEREALMRKARQLETASHINEWLTSPGLQSPR